jgi:hypothetical protein
MILIDPCFIGVSSVARVAFVKVIHVQAFRNGVRSRFRLV